MTTGFYTDERCFWHSVGMQALFLPVGGWVQPPSGAAGADTPDSKRRLLSLVQASGLIDHLAVASADPVSREDMLRVHTVDYIDRFKATSDAGGGDLGGFAPFSQGGYEIAALSAGLAKRAVDDVLSGRHRNAYALCRPAGHHCLPDGSMGFCLLCNIPIAIEAARARHGALRVAVVDWDVHHGNGTQAVYYGRDDTLTISLHQENCFPPGYSGEEDRGEGRGAGCNLNIPLPPGAGDEAYRHALRALVIPAIERFRPDLIVVASGLDAGAADPLARMLVHSETFRAMTGELMALADRLCGGKLVVVHEGGYSEAVVPFLGLAIIETLSGHRTDVVDPTLDIFVPQQPGAKSLAFQRQVIDEMVEAWTASQAGI
ncbi:histone deacetylase superfamily [Rhizorhabdus wittichii RW1]|uniref:Histone deacetylase superfamily n=2 Tax=Rhizorhabdus wittichii TaxID=160791 RepID=A0A9J9HFU8_RHIWR|nr:class II histone deacetylase [Rhizorhabdus wittichii]ABQ70689.1 histone deacetylase superfamily [Rhizorhabdus wittichii RW1]QTH23800.1 class II histone deacetylase [Rhizorhabdus wittichii]